jgi:deazaflavin-dependent oxidoreductase (nitroreductase family)
VAEPRPAFQEPDWFSRRVFNPAVAGLTRLGISLFGSRVLRVRGRRSGQWREVPVNPLTQEGARYLVAPRGETQWVRNLRAAGGGELRVGRRRERFTATEVTDEAVKLAVMREYLRRWKWEVGAFFGGVGADSPDDELRAESRRHPIFRLQSP